MQNCLHGRSNTLALVKRRLAEVAKYVGVSEKTVSRVLNGKPGTSDATRAAVPSACWVKRSSSRNGSVRISMVVTPASPILYTCHL